MAAYYARRTGEDPDDLLQEAWLGLLEALPALDVTIGSPDQYLIQRARWRMLDAVKRSRVRRCDPLDDGHTDHRAERAFARLVDSESVSAFSGQLKTNQRQVLEHLLAGRTWREAGEALGCTCANVAYHVRQIRRRYEEWSIG